MRHGHILSGAACALLALSLWGLPGCGGRPGDAGPRAPAAGAFQGRTLELFCGAASKPATEEAARLFEEKTGARLLLHFGGSGKMLAEMKLNRRGDVYFPGSSDFMEQAKQEKIVAPETERIVAFLVPSINVPRGNPKGIRTVEDLGRPGLRVGIGRPDSVCLGLYAVEIFEGRGLAPLIRPNIVAYAESCDKTAAMISLGTVDAVIGWSIFAAWDPEQIETVAIPPERLPRLGYLPIAAAAGAREREAAEAFIAFLSGPDGKAVFRRFGYLTTEEEARLHARPSTPIGGVYKLPPGWP